MWQVGKAEKITAEERQEMGDFLDALAATSVFQFAFHWLMAHGKDPRCKKVRNMQEFRNLVFDLWFAPYSRSRGKAADSSGFEHVFVGEEKDGNITGLHNWVQYYLEEKKGKIDYQVTCPFPALPTAAPPYLHTHTRLVSIWNA